MVVLFRLSSNKVGLQNVYNTSQFFLVKKRNTLQTENDLKLSKSEFVKTKSISYSTLLIQAIALLNLSIKILPSPLHGIPHITYNLHLILSANTNV